MAMVAGEASASAGSAKKVCSFIHGENPWWCVGEVGGGVGGRHA